MTYDDPYDLPAETWAKKTYTEFVLPLADKRNLTEIEKSLSEGKIDSSNRDWMIEYLEKLHKHIADVKRKEFAFEGDENLNVNMYLRRVKHLIEQLHTL